MSSAHHLTPPADFSKPLLALACGISLAIITLSLTRSTLPFSGDPNHSLPFGGLYKDGTKTILFNKPGTSTKTNHTAWALGAIFCLTAIITARALADHTHRVCRCCSKLH
ncbi:triple gene block 2 [Chaenostoma potexvirus]|uniref:Triple gene block 2 n=2 Tax=Riboviria TaxID=2559587 RepID=A0AAE9SGP9_9VIRU|nr:triple gene block 2 protein [Sutera flower mottle virus]UOF93378.1 triple gene block 2 protein [Sutera flower mottle virus]UTI93306.1 triple gene block 2 [Chaenostoma potexvirus]